MGTGLNPGNFKANWKLSVVLFPGSVSRDKAERECGDGLNRQMLGREPGMAQLEEEGSWFEKIAKRGRSRP